MLSVRDFLLRFVGLGFAIVAPIKSAMIAAGVLIFIDLLTGIWRAIKQNEKITSNGLRRTITKLAAFQLAIVTGFIIEKYMIDIVPVLKIVLSVIALTESKSIFENINAITGVNFWQAILDKLQSTKEVPKP